MTDWVSASAMLFAGLLVGAIFLYTMRRRQVRGEGERADLEAKRDALLAQLRSVDNSSEERGRLERETADVLRKLDRVRASSPAPAAGETSAVTPAASSSRDTLKGFAWGAASMAVLAGIAWFVVQSAKPKSDAQPNTMGPASASAATSTAMDPIITQLQQQVQQDPNNLSVRDDLARAYLEKDNINGVAEQTQFVLQRNPNDARALTYQALVHIAARQPDAALAMLLKATKSDPKLIDAWVGLAWVHAQNGDLDQAQAAIDEAKKQHPEESARLDDLMNHLRNPQQPPASVPSTAAANVAPAQQPASVPSPAAAPSQPGQAVHITINAAPRQYPPTAVLFVFALDAGSNGGPPAAVKRLPVGQFPVTVDLSSADSMMGQPLPAKMKIEARIALDGDPMNQDPKDPFAAVDGVGLGKSVSLTLK